MARRQRETMEEATKKKGKALKIIAIIILILIVLIAGIGILGMQYVNNKLSKIDYDDLPAEEIEVNAGVEEQLETYRNIALLGLDARADTFDGTRSDCIMIVSINQKTNEVRLLSVYRDTYLELTDRSLDKITHAYAYGGPKLTLSTLNTNLDLNITEYVTVNFETVRTVVNAIGGIQMTVTDAEAKSIPNITSAGTYNLMGDQALAYARIRKIDTDYKRTERMRDVLTAIFNKVKTLNIKQINNLIDTVLPHIRTNIQKTEILSLAPKVATYKITNSIGWPYEVRAYTTPTWYGAPVTLEENVVKLHQELFDEENYEPSAKVKEISNKIIKKTGYQ